MISFIFAMDDEGAIGKNNQLPWHLPEDLKFFKRVTMGHPIVMGRKTHEAIGRLLPGRKNIIITRNADYHCDGVVVFHSVQDFISGCFDGKEEMFVIGGAEIFKAMFKFADRLYITRIHDVFDGDTFFPEFDISKWKLSSCEKGIKNDSNPYEYEFCIYDRCALHEA